MWEREREGEETSSPTQPEKQFQASGEVKLTMGARGDKPPYKNEERQLYCTFDYD